MTTIAPPATTGRIAFDPHACRTCRVCETACSIAHEGVASPALARINIFFDEFSLQEPIRGVICYQCLDAPCMEICPVEALYRDELSGAVCIDADKCIGCMQCRKACPWDVPKRHPEKRLALKCDLCADRSEGPACLQICPLVGKALTRIEPTTQGE